MGLRAWKHALQVVDALPHDLDILQAVLSRLSTSEGQDGRAPFHPAHMHLQSQYGDTACALKGSRNSTACMSGIGTGHQMPLSGENLQVTVLGMAGFPQSVGVVCAQQQCRDVRTSGRHRPKTVLYEEYCRACTLLSQHASYSMRQCCDSRLQKLQSCQLIAVLAACFPRQVAPLSTAGAG